jgi:serine/threonine protein kinase
MKIMHRDIKTENILRVQHGIKLGDLGLSTVVSGSKAGIFSIVGTPIFNAPERFKPGYDFNADIWSVGMVLY